VREAVAGRAVCAAVRPEPVVPVSGVRGDRKRDFEARGVIKNEGGNDMSGKFGEPWEITEDLDIEYLQRGEKRYCKFKEFLDYTSAKRITACVNACKGIEHPGEYVKALERVRAKAVDEANETCSECHRFYYPTPCDRGNCNAYQLKTALAELDAANKTKEPSDERD